MVRNGLMWMFLIVGTMIGAGYASGREIWEFFGSESGLAIFLFMILFIICSYVVMHISYKHQSAHYLPVLHILMGKRISKLYDVMIILYLFTTTVIMLAGGGATLEVVHFPFWAGVVIVAAFVVVLFIWDTDGITTIHTVITPILIFALVSVLFAFQSLHGFPLTFWEEKQGNWPTALTFTALNILPLISVLGAIGQKIKGKGEIVIAAVGSGTILGGLTFLYNSSLIEVASELVVYEIPLFAILQHYPYYMVLVMSGILWVAIYTTAASGVFGLISRIREYIQAPAWVLALMLVAIMAPLTMFGFSNLISFLYPLYGVLNLYLFSSIMLYPILHHKAIRPKIE
ncbi:membrane protein [Alkalihalobacillus pseudalcaliphilus]|uniref:YkvI family membrane protein n=1 Tax=Alkalihalobacillus pseudalcaliphilus TaxID=79884 RepID=UPI00064E08BA|nr:membrane protein [Alkalihalobacillus pseudalcaliphilus]KMK77907.1 membrane protein [Alkalihalobacillus pseudalcaliphilus]